MGVFNLFPFTNFEEKNLDWIIKKIKEIQNFLDNDLRDIVGEYVREFTISATYDATLERLTFTWEEPNNG